MLVDCPDEVGLIHRIAGVLVSRRLNVETNHEFVDAKAGHFFWRAEIVGSDIGPAQELVAALRQVLPEAANVRVAVAEHQPIVVFVTREPHCLGELLLREACGELPARIAAVAGNHEALRSLAERFGKPFVHVPSEGATREEHESGLLRVIEEYAPRYVILARYMRVLSEQFIARIPDRIVNIHHSFLPAFAGASPYRQAYDRGVKVIGATAHFVTAALDEGPIIAQDVTPVDHSFTAERMAQAGRDVEKIVLARAVRLVLEERVFIHGRRTVVFE